MFDPVLHKFERGLLLTTLIVGNCFKLLGGLHPARLVGYMPSVI